MNNVIRSLAVGSLLALAAGAASADVTVNYVQPERFSDLPFTSWEREAVLKELTGHFAKLGAQLPPGQNLRVDVLDIDLAGREYPGRAGRDLRIVKQVDWPRMDLRYTIEQDGQVLLSGEAQLRDMAFMDHIRSYRDSESLSHEKRMIDDWFYSTIVPRDRAAGR
jgi:hypothetical protein